MGQYALNQLITYTTPKSETMLKFPDIGNVEFSFPTTIKTVLFIYCNKRGFDEYECCGRLYESDNPRETGELHVGKLFINFSGSSEGNNYKTIIEILEHHKDGSFTIISEDGKRNHIKKSF